MSNINKTLETIISTHNFYINELNSLSEQELNFKSSAEIWSISQLYEHLSVSGLKFFLANTKRCLEKRNGKEGGEPNPNGQNLLAAGSFPPIKIKVPGGLAAEIIPRSNEEYILDFKNIISSAQVLSQLLEHDPGTYTIVHPVFGDLNGLQWFMNLEMHSRHHLTQLAELKTLAHA